jgi:N-acetylneuraminic acid mutarotase
VISTGFSQPGSWNQKATIPTARCFAASCELNGKIYVIGGGKTTSSRLNAMEVYDPSNNTWDTTKTDMPTARVELCVAAISGKIYVIGGATAHSGSPLGMVEEYDPLTGSWDTNKTPMPTARKGAAYGVIHDKIYIAGGSADANYTPSNILEIYDPATDTWTSGASMLAGRYYPQGAVLNDTLYVIGGLIGSPWTGQTLVQKYDPTTDNWEFGTNLNYGRVGHTADAVNGKIYVIGGDKQPPIIMNVEEYDPQTKTWTVIDTIPSAMIIHSSSVYDNRIYVFSGTVKTISQLTLTNNVYSFNPSSITSLESQKKLKPDVFVLHQNYPNPFNPTTVISWQLTIDSPVNLSVYNLAGQRVTVLVNEKQAVGSHSIEFDASNLASGIYFYRLEAGQHVDNRRMILMK